LFYPDVGCVYSICTVGEIIRERKFLHRQEILLSELLVTRTRTESVAEIDIETRKDSGGVNIGDFCPKGDE
jgi:hypothetical protein